MVQTAPDFIACLTLPNFVVNITRRVAVFFGLLGAGGHV